MDLERWKPVRELRRLGSPEQHAPRESAGQRPTTPLRMGVSIDEVAKLRRTCADRPCGAPSGPLQGFGDWALPTPGRRCACPGLTCFGPFVADARQLGLVFECKSKSMWESTERPRQRSDRRCNGAPVCARCVDTSRACHAPKGQRHVSPGQSKAAQPQSAALGRVGPFHKP